MASKLNLGCGKLHKKGYINCDIKEPADEVFDVTKGLPFEDSSCSLIEADNLLEHIGDEFIFVMNECHRVLEHGGKLWIKVPDAERWLAGAIGDPTHKRFFCERTFNYLNRFHPTHQNYATDLEGWTIESLETDGKFITATLCK